MLAPVMPMDGPVPTSPRPLSLPREQWRRHPHFATQTLLLGSHENFRRISTMLVDNAGQAATQAWIGRLYAQWIAAMRSHEAYEEYKLYPFLTRRWGLSFAEAEAGHQRLHACDGEVRAAFDRGRGEGDSPDVLRIALERHDGVLREHLRHEEDLVIPALLALTPREFEDYYRS
ncbi:MAG: hemerythrin domain-containing protein [Deltaproteobacteria bacterium]|nr:hemerythrin domain-containing protein [Deltaproteobacteria bacterium]